MRPQSQLACIRDRSDEYRDRQNLAQKEITSMSNITTETQTPAADAQPEAETKPAFTGRHIGAARTRETSPGGSGPCRELFEPRAVQVRSGGS